MKNCQTKINQLTYVAYSGCCHALPCTLTLTKSQTKAGVGVGTFPQALDVYTVYDMQGNPTENKNFLDQTRLVKILCGDVSLYTMMAIDSKEGLTG